MKESLEDVSGDDVELTELLDSVKDGNEEEEEEEYGTIADEVLDDKSEALGRADDEEVIMLAISKLLETELLEDIADGGTEMTELLDSVENKREEEEEEIEEETAEVAASELLDETSEALEGSDEENIKLDTSELLGVEVIIAVDESLDVKEVEDAEVLVGKVKEEEENGGIELLKTVAGSDEGEVVEALKKLEEVSEVG